MRWNVILGMMVAVGSLSATEARAQGNAAGSGATATPGSEKSTEPSEERTDPYTINADGTVSRKPNPMSRFLKRSRQSGNIPMEMPLVDDYREDGAGSGQTN